MIEAACPNCGWRESVETLAVGHAKATEHNAFCVPQRKRPLLDEYRPRSVRAANVIEPDRAPD